MRLPLRGHSGLLSIVPLLLPIVAGRPHDGDAAVVGLLRGGRVFCTGVLIAPRVVLTAGHCLSRGRPDGVFFGAQPGGGGRSIGIVDTRIDLGFEPTAARDDLGLLLLAEAAPASPAPLLPRTARMAVGVRARLVGFGTARRGDRAPPRKREGWTRIERVSAGELGFGPSPSQTCDEDSGAPVFIREGGRELGGGDRFGRRP